MSETEQAERDQLVSDISLFYPAEDSETGERLLWQAICHNWDALPLPILRRYWWLCRWEEQR